MWYVLFSLLFAPLCKVLTRSREINLSYANEFGKTGTAQSFVVSKLSALHLANVAETPRSLTNVQSQDTTAPLNMQASTICCSCGGVQGWQYTQSFVKRKSKSYVDLRVLAGIRRGGGQQDWEWAKRPKLQQVIPAHIEEPAISPPGSSPLEMLPTEILGEGDSNHGRANGSLMTFRPDNFSASTRLATEWIYSAKRGSAILSPDIPHYQHSYNDHLEPQYNDSSLDHLLEVPWTFGKESVTWSACAESRPLPFHVCRSGTHAADEF